MHSVKFKGMARCSNPARIKSMETCSKLRRHVQHIAVLSSSEFPPKQKLILGLDCRHCFSSLARAYSTVNLSNLRSEILLREIELFPDSISSLNIVNARVQSELHLPSIYIVKFTRSTHHFKCELQLNWPRIKCFIGVGPTEAQAQSEACLQALSWFYTNRLINEAAVIDFNRVNEIMDQGSPTRVPRKRALRSSAHSPSELAVQLGSLLASAGALRSSPLPPGLQTPAVGQQKALFINLSERKLKKVDRVLQIHKEIVSPILKSLCESSHHDEGVQCKEKFHPTLHIPFPSRKELEDWNEILNSMKKPPQHQTPLPIDSCQAAIIDSLKINRVVIVKGEQGCGKTTRVPQFILDESIKDGQGAYCNIAVSVPLQNDSMVKTVNRIANERREEVGSTVGYWSDAHCVPPCVKGGSITFIDYVILLRKFATDPCLRGVSHVILDEVHLRLVQTDHIMTLVKKAMMLRENLKVIIMGTNFDDSVLKSYFSHFGEVPVIEVPGCSLPVKMNFLDDLPFEVNVNEELLVNEESTIKIVSWINETKPEGAILVLCHSKRHMRHIQRILEVDENLMVIKFSDQFGLNAVQQTPENKRKVVLALLSDALLQSEVSLTLADIVYVLDPGSQKTTHRHILSPGGWSIKRVSRIRHSKATMLQLKSLAGRLKPGESFHLVTKNEFMKMSDYSPPKIIAQNLEKTVLRAKMVNPCMTAVDLLKEFPSPPSERDVQQAVHTLRAASLLSSNETPTPLARAVMKIDYSLQVGLALIQSAIFRCFDLTMSSLAGRLGDNELLLKDQGTGNLAKAKSLSDTDKTVVSPQPSHLGVTDHTGDLLKRLELVCPSFKMSNLNEHSSEEMVKSVLLNSFGYLLLKDNTSAINKYLVNRSGVPAMVDHTNIQRKKNIDDAFLMVLNPHVAQGQLVVAKASPVSPLSVLLFLLSALEVSNVEGGTTYISAWHLDSVQIALPSVHYEKLEALRKAVKDVFDYFVVAEALGEPDANFKNVNKFRGILLDCLKDILSNK